MTSYVTLESSLNKHQNSVTRRVIYIFLVIFLTLKHFQYITSFLPKCFHFIPPENTRKQWFLYFIREYNTGKLARNGLILRIWRCSAKFPLYESTTFSSIIQYFITSLLTCHSISQNKILEFSNLIFGIFCLVWPSFISNDNFTTVISSSTKPTPRKTLWRMD